MASSTQGGRDEAAVVNTLQEAELDSTSDLGARALGARPTTTGRTDFENHRLNEMLDLVDSAAPERITDAGDALLRARTAINKAANELDGHIERIDWEGESGEAFRKWGKRLVKNTRRLGDFAEQTGVQVTAVGNGLASVRKSMPGRDERDDPKTVDDIPKSKQKEGNPEYDAAMKVEKDRQEAIAQMTRLSSYYSVAEENLAKEKGPSFGALPSLGVPEPQDRHRAGASDAGASGGPADSASTAKGSPEVGVNTTPQSPDKAFASSEPPTIESQPVSTRIDSAEPLAPQATERGYNTASPPQGNPTPQANTMPPPPAAVPGGHQPTARPSPALPGNKPPGAAGMARPTGPGQQGSVPPRPLTQSSPNPTSGTTGRTAGTSPPATGRSVSPGALPARGVTPSPHPRASQRGGIVGGIPRPASPSSDSSHLPRGQVVGGMPNGGRQRPTSVPSKPDARNRKWSSNSSTGLTSRTEGSISTNGENTRIQFTPGGTGLVRRDQEGRYNPGSDGTSAPSTTGSHRRQTNYFTGDDKSQHSRRSTTAPPVIE